MAWVETDSLSFSARHESEDAEAAAAMLDRLEAFRSRMDRLFDTTPGDVSVVMHAHPAALALAHPWLPLARVIAAPAGRRYMAGWFSRDEIHVLSPAALAARASRVEGSREALLLSPLHEYAHLVVGANNPQLPPPFTARSFSRYVRWAWLCEGAAVHFSGQGPHLRAAMARRLREGGRPAFPPAARDATLLGGTVLGLLERTGGAEACVRLATRLDPAGAAAAIEREFERPLAAVEREWRGYLDRAVAAG
ncbi:MAG TPA: hypothetical protein VF545_09410 [Thermoleophilaceae bacterium]